MHGLNEGHIAPYSFGQTWQKYGWKKCPPSMERKQKCKEKINIVSELHMICYDIQHGMPSQTANVMGPIWGPPGSCRPQMGPMLPSWTLLSGMGCTNVIPLLLNVPNVFDSTWLQLWMIYTTKQKKTGVVCMIRGMYLLSQDLELIGPWEM